MSRRIDLPDEDHVREVLNELIAESVDAGTRPTVIGLARRLHLSNGTFWRHYPAIATEIRQHTTPTHSSHGTNPGKSDPLKENARLRRSNHSLTQDLELALASIQRLSLENHSLRAQLEDHLNVARINGPQQPHPRESRSQ